MILQTKPTRPLLAVLSLALVGLFGFSQQADAGIRLYVGHRHIFDTGYHSCGCAIQRARIVTAFDRFGRPIYRYAPVRTIHRCGGRLHQRRYGNYHYPHGRVLLDRRYHRGHYDDYRHQRRQYRQDRRFYRQQSGRQ